MIGERKGMGETRQGRTFSRGLGCERLSCGRRSMTSKAFVVVFGLVALSALATAAAAQEVKTYGVNYVQTSPIIDGVLTTEDEWGGAASGSADWSLLTFNSPDATNNRFQAVWDDSGIYLKHEVEYSNWRDAGRQWDPTYEALNFYFDPNVDGETNENSAAFPFISTDGYQLSINQPLGFSSIDSSQATAGAEASAYVDASFGNSAGAFSGFANTMVSQTTSIEESRGYFEMFIPWADFDAAAPDSGLSDTGLYHPEAPSSGDQWFFNVARTQSNFITSAWSSPDSAQAAAQRPHGILEFLSSGTSCDVDGSGECDAADIDAIAQAVLEGNQAAQFDINGDGSVTNDDRVHYVEVVRNTYIGDANLDGEFGTRDFVAVFGVGGYEDSVVGNSTWASGDWNGDFEFDTRDFVAAFISGGFEAGPRAAAAAAVPEPASQGLALCGVLLAWAAARRRR